MLASLPVETPLTQLGAQAARVESDRERWSALLTLIAEKVESALEQLYDETKDIVYGLVFRILRDAAIAEEVTMDVYLKVWDQAARFSAEKGSALTWMLVIARSKALDRIRYESSRLTDWVEIENVALSSPALSPDSTVEARILRTKIERLLAQVPSAHRRAVELAFFEGMSHSEIAELLGEPIGTIKSRIRTTLLKLKEGILN